jgi:hypothetical protein
LANVPEQGFKIGRHRIAGAMEVADHLVQIVSEPDKLAVDELIEIAFPLVLYRRPPALIEEERAAEVDGAHADRFGAALDIFKLAWRQVEIQLLASRFWFFRSSHESSSLQSACVLGFGGHQPAPNESPFAYAKGHLATLSPNLFFSSSLSIVMICICHPLPIISE